MARHDPAGPRPIRLAIVNDYGVVLAGVKAMLEPFRHRVDVVELVANEPVTQPVDVVLYDTFAQPEPHLGELETLLDNPMAHHVVVFSWTFDADLVEQALGLGASGYLSKTLDAADLVDALEAVAGGAVVVDPPPSRVQRTNADLDWPGREHGLSEREAEILALIVQGHPNARIAELVHLSVNTIKGHIRSAYRKIGVRNRVEAVLWGTRHGMVPDEIRQIEHWRGS